MLFCYNLYTDISLGSEVESLCLNKTTLKQPGVLICFYHRSAAFEQEFRCIIQMIVFGIYSCTQNLSIKLCCHLHLAAKLNIKLVVYVVTIKHLRIRQATSPRIFYGHPLPAMPLTLLRDSWKSKLTIKKTQQKLHRFNTGFF